MRSLKKYLLVAIGFALAGMFGAAFGSGPAHALVAALVQIVNTAANPVITQHVAADNPATQAVNLNCQITGFNLNVGSCTLENGPIQNPPYVVPNGKRLVIESVSGQFLVPTGVRGEAFFHVSDATGTIYSFAPPPSFEFTDSTNTDHIVFGLATRLYAEQGTTVTVSADLSSSNAGNVSELGVSAFGHLENIQ